jgi:hypothetical protein
MGWFSKMCRNVGLMVHNVRKPDHREKKVVRKDVEERIEGDVTYRRTTIDEVEVKRNDS